MRPQRIFPDLSWEKSREGHFRQASKVRSSGASKCGTEEGLDGSANGADLVCDGQMNRRERAAIFGVFGGGDGLDRKCDRRENHIAKITHDTKVLNENLHQFAGQKDGARDAADDGAKDLVLDGAENDQTYAADSKETEIVESVQAIRADSNDVLQSPGNEDTNGMVVKDVGANEKAEIPDHTHITRSQNVSANEMQSPTSITAAALTELRAKHPSQAPSSPKGDCKRELLGVRRAANPLIRPFAADKRLPLHKVSNDCSGREAQSARNFSEGSKAKARQVFDGSMTQRRARMNRGGVQNVEEVLRIFLDSGAIGGVKVSKSVGERNDHFGERVENSIELVSAWTNAWGREGATYANVGGAMINSGGGQNLQRNVEDVLKCPRSNGDMSATESEHMLLQHLDLNIERRKTSAGSFPGRLQESDVGLHTEIDRATRTFANGKERDDSPACRSIEDELYTYVDFRSNSSVDLHYSKQIKIGRIQDEEGDKESYQQQPPDSFANGDFLPMDILKTLLALKSAPSVLPVLDQKSKMNRNRKFGGVGMLSHRIELPPAGFQHEEMLIRKRWREEEDRREEDRRRTGDRQYPGASEQFWEILGESRIFGEEVQI